ncbi:MAG TPA: hypothetical protein VIV57_00720, partial [Anaeromyxobacter sp.]
MAFATLSFDVAAQSPSRPAIFAAVKQAVAARTTWRLLTREWMIQFASIADFEAFAAALEALHAQFPSEFDYFALHFEPTGGPVVIAPNPQARQPAPIPGAAMAAARAAPTAAAPAAVSVADPAPVLSQLRDLHAFKDWESQPAVGERPRRGGRGR